MPQASNISVVVFLCWLGVSDGPLDQSIWRTCVGKLWCPVFPFALSARFLTRVEKQSLLTCSVEGVVDGHFDDLFVASSHGSGVGVSPTELAVHRKLAWGWWNWPWSLASSWRFSWCLRVAHSSFRALLWRLTRLLRFQLCDLVDSLIDSCGSFCPFGHSRFFCRGIFAWIRAFTTLV